MNEPIRRFSLDRIGLHESAQAGQTQPVKDMSSLPYDSVSVGTIASLKSSMQVSSNGDHALAMRINNLGHSQLLKQSFSSKKCLVYGFTHKELARTVLLLEKRDVVFTAGFDKLMVAYNYQSGHVLRIIRFNLLFLDSLYRVENLICVSGLDRIHFVDVNRLERIGNMQLRVDSHNIRCFAYVNLPSEGSSENRIQYLLVGGIRSKYLFKFCASKLLENQKSVYSLDCVEGSH